MGCSISIKVDLQTPATKLKATGQFSFDGDSNLHVDLNSSDAAELQAVLISSGLLTEVEEQMSSYGIDLDGAAGLQRQRERKTQLAGYRRPRLP